MFAIYIDDIVHRIKATGLGCYLGQVCCSIYLFADDILLLAPSILSLQQLFSVCENELADLDLSINVKKSVCTRIGQFNSVDCCQIKTGDGKCLEWVDKMRYLGIFILRAKTFRCCYSQAKKSFYRAFNALYGKVGRLASEEVVISLIKFKCLPCLLYGLDACPVNKSEGTSLDFPVTRILMKIFQTTNRDIISDCQSHFNLPPVHILIRQRKVKFLQKYIAVENLLCNRFCSIATAQLAKLINDN
jgi:hypothetical protein